MRAGPGPRELGAAQHPCHGRKPSANHLLEDDQVPPHGRGSAERQFVDPDDS